MFFLYIIMLIIGLFFSKKQDAFFDKSYNPIFIFLSVNFLYTAIGILSLSSDSQFQGKIIEFLFIQITGVLGMIASILLIIPISNSLKIHSAVKDYQPKLIRQSLRGNMTLCLVFLLLLIFLNQRFGGVYSIFSEGYSLILNKSDGSLSGVSLDDLIFIYIFPITLLVLGYAQGFNKFWMLISLLYLMMLSMLGTRNAILMYAGSALILYSFQNKVRFNYFYVILFLLIGIPLFLINAFVRNIGFQALINNMDMLFVIDLPSLILKGGEFFTSINVFLVHSAWPEWWQGVPGESYFNVLLSIIPKLIWPNRPDAISNTFSDLFAPPGEGIGFSVNLEAFVNFGIIGVFFINLFISYFWLFIYHLANYSNNFLYFYLYSLVLFTAFNINRIDFQTVFKMGWLQYVIALIIVLLLRYLVRIRVSGRVMRKVGI